MNGKLGRMWNEAVTTDFKFSFKVFAQISFASFRKVRSVQNKPKKCMLRYNISYI